MPVRVPASRRFLACLLCAGAIALACVPRTRSEPLPSLSTAAPAGAALSPASTRAPNAAPPAPKGATQAGAQKPAAKGGKHAAPQPTGPVLVTTLEVQAEGASQPTATPTSVRFVFHVTNRGDEKVELDFPTGKTYDFAVLDAAGHELWRWSAQRMFTSAMQTKPLGVGESTTVEARWETGGRRGAFVVVGTLPSTNMRVEQRTPFTLP